jgi:adenine phosphoribosyltransferase
MKNLIRSIPNYPKSGIIFRDITKLIKDPNGLNLIVKEFLDRYDGIKIDKVAGIESRGFIIGSPIAYALGIGFIPIRKKGKSKVEGFVYNYDGYLLCISDASIHLRSLLSYECVSQLRPQNNKITRHHHDYFRSAHKFILHLHNFVLA